MRSSVRRPALAGAIAAALALLASLLVPIPAMAADVEPGWRVENGSKTASGAIILNEGHIDIASLLEGDVLTTKVKDTTLGGEPVWRDPAQTVLQVRPDARMTVPAAAEYGFLGTPGADTWILGQSQKAGLLWPGWSTEGIAASATRTGFDWTLTDASGPGEFALYEGSSSSLGGVDVLFDTRDGVTDADSFSIPQTTHAHGSWAFSAEGTYCLAFSRSTTVAAGATVSTDFVLAVAVGAVDVAAVNPATCFPAEPGPVEPTTPVTTPTATPTAAPEPTAAPQPTTPPTPSDPVVWDVSNGSTTRSGAVILNDGHVDIASRITDGALTTQVKDTTSSTAVFRELSDTVLQLKPSSALKVPASATYEFLGHPGEPLWQVSQSQQSGLLWPGWSTEQIATTATTTGIDWALTDMSGPGEFALYESSATALGDVDVLFNTRDGITSADSFRIPKNTHAHGAWAFSAEGVYCLAFNRSATLASGMPVSDDFVLAVAVGRVAVTTIDPASCFTAPAGEPAGADSVPIADNLLTPDAAGDLGILAAENGFAAGQLIGVSLGAARAGDWVSAWLHSAPEWLGWQQADANGLAQVRLPVSATVGDHKLVVKAHDGSLIGWATLRIVAPPVSGGGPPGAPPPADAVSTPPSQSVAATQCVAGATILSSGHIDYASRIVGGKLESLIKDGTTQSTVWREPSGVVMWLKPSSRITLPGGYSAVGAAGSTVWQIPQTQNPNLMWLGWNTEAINSGQAASQVTWALNSVEGPGTVNVYLQGAFGGVQSVVFSDGGSHNIDLGKHVHGNWAFSAEGIYRLNLTQSITLANGKVSSDTETLTIAVGDVNPATAVSAGSGCGVVSNASLLTADIAAADAEAAAAWAAAQAEADAQAADAARTELPGMSTLGADQDNPFAALTNGNPVAVLLLGLGVLLVLGSALGAMLWRRQRHWAAVTEASASPIGER